MRQLLRQIKIQQTNFAREREEESVVVDNEVVWSIYQRGMSRVTFPRGQGIKQSQFLSERETKGKRASIVKEYSSEIEEVGRERSWSRLVLGRLDVSRNVAWIIATVGSVFLRGLKTGRAIFPSPPSPSLPAHKGRNFTGRFTPGH